MSSTTKSSSFDIEHNIKQSEGFWLQPLTLKQRLIAFSWRAGVAFAVASWLTYVQLTNNVQDLRLLWSFGIIAFGLVMAIRAFKKCELRVYATTVVHYNQRQRLRRSANWFLPGLALLAAIWTIQSLNDQFKEYWLYAWPALALLIPGVGLYFLRSENVISGLGLHAKAEHEAIAAKARQERGEWANRLFAEPLVRYAIAALCFYGAYYFAFEDNRPKAWLGSTCALIVGLVFAREMSLWLIGIGVVCLIGWALFAGIAALPISVAVIVGALIIASALKK